MTFEINNLPTFQVGYTAIFSPSSFLNHKFQIATHEKNCLLETQNTHMCSPLLTIFGFYPWLSLLASGLRSLALANSVDACQAIVFQNINHEL